jgi:hypothetical protein
MDYSGATLAAALLPLPADSAFPGWSPSSVYTGYSDDGTGITIPIASLLSLTAASANATTGDARQVVLSLMSSAFNWYNNSSEKPSALTMTFTPSKIESYGSFSGKQKVEYKVSAYTTFATGLVADEPA